MAIQPPGVATKTKLPSLKDLVVTMSHDFKWLKSSRTMETFWDGQQRRECDFYDIAELYHENTKMRRHAVLQVALSTDIFMKQYTFMDAGTKAYKAYPNQPRIVLPRKNLSLKASLDDVLLNRRSLRNFTGESIDLNDLARLLYYSCGITWRVDFEEWYSHRPLRQFLRAIPSGGALYPVEVYLGVLHVDGLKPGIYHYNVFEHALEVLREIGDFETSFPLAFPVHPDIVPMDRAAVVVMLTGVFPRPRSKYGPRAYRYVMQESGHMMQNWYLASTALRLGAVALAGFFDDEINHWLGVDGVDEAAVYVMALGRIPPHSEVGVPVTLNDFDRLVRW